MMDDNLRQRLSGIFTALVTPMTDGAVDMASFEAHVERQLEAGVQGISPIGTTGEASALTDAEVDAVVSATVKRAKGQAFVMVGAGANATSVAVDKAKRAADLGADGLLVVVPYYNKPSQRGIIDHFARVAQAVPIPVMVYNVPGRTGVDLTVESCISLVKDVPNIVAVKEAGGKVERIAELSIGCNGDASIFTGDDLLALPALCVGGAGVFSVASNLVPHKMVAMHRACVEGRLADARAIYRKIYHLLDHLFIESNPVPVKAALAHRGFMRPDVRAPLASLTEASWNVLEKDLLALAS